MTTNEPSWWYDMIAAKMLADGKPLFPVPEQGDNGCPPAHNGCKCSCHSVPGVMHCVPCCYPAVSADENVNLYEEANQLIQKISKPGQVWTVSWDRSTETERVITADSEGIGYVGHGNSDRDALEMIVNELRWVLSEMAEKGQPVQSACAVRDALECRSPWVSTLDRRPPYRVRVLVRRPGYGMSKEWWYDVLSFERRGYAPFTPGWQGEEGGIPLEHFTDWRFID